MNSDNLVVTQPEKEINYIIYETTNLLNGMIYVGYHVTKNLNDKYLGSGRGFLKAVKEFSRSNFKRKILYIFDNKKDMLEMEAKIVDEEFIKREDTYNLVPRGMSGCGEYNKGRKHTEEVKERIRKTLTGKKRTEEIKEKISLAQKGRKKSIEQIKKIKGQKRSQESRLKMRNVHLGKKLSQESIRKRQETRRLKGILPPMTGKKFSEKHRKKISESNIGKSLSNETKQKISEGNKGKKRSEEIKKKLSELRKGIKLGPHSKEHRKKISEAHLRNSLKSNIITTLNQSFNA